MNVRKTTIIAMLSVLTITLATLLVISLAKLNQKPIEYSFDIETEDFSIKDINLVAFNDQLYLAPNYYLELGGTFQQFDGILITGTIHGKRILDTGIGGDPFHRRETHLTEYIGEGTLFNDTVVTEDTILKVQITYTVDSVKKDYSEDIKLAEKIKPSVSE
ncbi:hypothetical protein D3C74_156800 [compost metagenome]